MNYSGQFPERKILRDSREEDFGRILRNENPDRFQDWIWKYLPFLFQLFFFQLKPHNFSFILDSFNF